jgi:2-polyprenyl-6-hydroxyphenyl methylase/3-demethylubiquinone-9 3-methyltransferase
MNIKNLDHDEVNKFDELAAKWWDKNGEFKPLHQINPLRVGFIKERSLLEGKKVLDVGCGGGILAEALDELGASVTGIDASENTIGVAKTHSKSIGSDVKYIQSTIEGFISSYPEERFDVITCLEMLEHVPSPNERRWRHFFFNNK